MGGRQWAVGESMSPCPKAGCGPVLALLAHVRFDEGGEWKRSRVKDTRAPATERVGNRPSQHLNHRAVSLLYNLVSIATGTRTR